MDKKVNLPESFKFMTSKSNFRLSLRLFSLSSRCFLLISSIPSVIITISSLFIFNYGIQNWFDNKILSLVNNSRSVAQNYFNFFSQNDFLAQKNDPQKFPRYYLSIFVRNGPSHSQTGPKMVFSHYWTK